jgi:hypothetical protein
MTFHRPCHRSSIAAIGYAIGYAIAPAIAFHRPCHRVCSIPPHPYGRKNGRLGACGARLPTASRLHGGLSSDSLKGEDRAVRPALLNAPKKRFRAWGLFPSAHDPDHRFPNRIRNAALFKKFLGAQQGPAPCPNHGNAMAIDRGSKSCGGREDFTAIGAIARFFLAPGKISFKGLNSKNPTVAGITSNNRGLQMTTESKAKSKKWGGKRAGAGRPRGGSDDRRAIAIEIALGGLDRALKVYGIPDDDWTPSQHRWHMAMVLLGVPTDIIAPAIFKPGVCEAFRRDLTAALRAVETSVAA